MNGRVAATNSTFLAEDEPGLVLSLQSRRNKQTARLGRAHGASPERSRRLLEAREEEAQRLAYELHDEIGGSLTALKMYVSRLSPTELVHSQAEIATMVGEILADTRQLCCRLRPSVVHDFGLIVALKTHVNTFAERTGIRVRLDCDDCIEAYLDEVQQVSVYRISQEALTNVAKHSGAKVAVIRLRRASESARLEIRDSGEGFVVPPIPQQSLSGHSGLAGIAERVTLLGGEFRIKSAPGEGTRLIINLPLGSR